MGHLAVDARPRTTADSGVQGRRRALNLRDDGAASVVDGVLVVGGAVLDVVSDGPADVGLELPQEPHALGLLLPDRVAPLAVGVLLVAEVRPGGCALSPDLAGVDPGVPVAVEDRGEDVDRAERNAQAPGSGDNAPYGGADGFLRVRLVAQLAEGVAAHQEHGKAEPYEPVTVAKDRPGGDDPFLPRAEGQFGPDEENADGGDEDEVDVSEKLEGVGHLGEDHHQEAGGGGRGEDEDVDRPQPVEDYIAGALKARATLKVEHAHELAYVECCFSSWPGVSCCCMTCHLRYVCGVRTMSYSPAAESGA